MHKKITANPPHVQAFLDDVAAVVNRHAGKVSVVEFIAGFASIMGQTAIQGGLHNTHPLEFVKALIAENFQGGINAQSQNNFMDKMQ